MTAAASKSSRTVLTSSDSESSSSSSDDARNRTVNKPSSSAAAASKSRLIPTSSDSDDSSDNDMDSVTLLKSRMTPADKSAARRTPATSTPAQAPPPRQKIYTSSDNDDDDSDSDSLTVTPVKKVKPSLSMSTPSSSKSQTKKSTQSATKKPPASSTPGKSVSKSCLQRESSTDSEMTGVAKSSKAAAAAAAAMKDDKKQQVKMREKHSRGPDSMLGSAGESLKNEKEVKKPVKSISDKPVPQHRASSSFIDALAKSSMHAKIVSKTATGPRDEKLSRKASRYVDVHKSSSAVSSVPDRVKHNKSSHTDVDALKLKHSVSDGRHATKSASGVFEKKGGLDWALKSGYDMARENSGRKVLEAEMLRSKKLKLEEPNGVSGEVESDESPLIRPGNIFEKMEQQDSSGDKSDETPAAAAAARMLGRSESGASRRRRASEIAVFMPESDDDDDDREPVMEPGKLSIERLKEESAKEETIEEAVKAIIEFTKEPSTPPHSSSKATDSEPVEDLSGETGDDDLGLSDDVGELNAAIGNLIEKELEPVGGDGRRTVGGGDKASDEDPTASVQYQPGTHGVLAEPKVEPSLFVGKSGFKEEVKMEVDSVARHIQTSVHDEQNVTSFMSRLEKATAGVVDFAAISAAAAASRRLSASSSEAVSTSSSSSSKPDISSRLFASSAAEDEKAVVVKKEECCEQTETVKPEPPEFPSSTRIFSSCRQSDVQVEKPGVAVGVTEAGSGEDSSTTADLYEFKDDDDDETEHGRQKEFVLHKRSRKRHADSESNDANDVVDVKKSRVIKSEQYEVTSSGLEQCPPSSASNSAQSTTVSSWQSHIDVVIDAVARGEFERGDDFNYYSTRNATTTTTKARRGRAAAAATSRDDNTTHKPVSLQAMSCGGTMPLDTPTAAAAIQFPRSVSAVTSAAMTAADHCPSKLLLTGLPSPQQLQHYRLGPPPSPANLAAAATCKFTIVYSVQGMIPQIRFHDFGAM